MTEQSQLFRLASSQNATQWREILSALCGAQPSKTTPVVRTRRLLETFDWLLHQNKISLWAIGDGPVQLRIKSSDESLGFLSDLDVETLPKTGDDLPNGAFRNKLEAVLDLRALLPLIVLEEKVYPLVIGTEEVQEQVQLELIDCTQKPGARRKAINHGLLLNVRALAGYEDIYQDCLDRLHTFEAISQISNDEFIGLCLQTIGRTPGDYSGKLNVQLTREMRSDEALKAILLDQLEQVEANLEGSIANWDTEFLHDLRVAVRRQRSALSRIKEVLPASMTEKFSADLKWVGTQTTPVRDLDVYLLDLPKYKSQLPDELRADLDPLIKHVQLRYDGARKDLVADLKSKQFQNFLSRWRSFLKKPVPARPSAANALLPIGELADRQIWKSYRKVIKEGSAITEDSPAEALHDLRKTCKKLRYLLEFFASLYPTKELTTLVKHLKKLQSNLGDFQDLDVQKETLYAYAEQMMQEGERRPNIYMTIGVLVNHFIKRKEEVHGEFGKQFADFASRDVKKLFKQLVKN